jgi:uncharacterized phiE125 gp8 family phage protein
MIYYELTEKPINMPIELDTVKSHLRIETEETFEDDYLKLLINSVVNYAESYTGREFLAKKFIGYFDYLKSGMEIEKSKLLAIESIKYYQNGVLLTAPVADYTVIKSNLYSKLNIINSISTDQLQGIQIEFTAGYGVEEKDIPYDLVLAMLSHIAKIYASRGDSEEDRGAMSSVIKSNLPLETLQTYNKYKIEDISL